MKRNMRIPAAILAFMLAGGAVTIPTAVSEDTAVYAASAVSAPKHIKTTADNDSVTISWDEVDDADAYRIYQYDSKTEKFVKIKTVTGTKATVTGLKSGKKYFFKVASLTKSGKSYKLGGVSNKVSVTTKGEAKAPAKKTTEKKKGGSVPTMPTFSSAGFGGIGHTATFTETGKTTTEIEQKLLADFDKYRFKVIGKGFKVKCTTHEADAGTYYAEYEVTYDGEHVYTIYEDYKVSGSYGNGRIQYVDINNPTSTVPVIIYY
ncbi:MAG: fibronectin type III domain-containing protein [Ruminococcus sp.]|nr:fibronectin type III domain-containing protein [Ruminococcus sp.]